MDALLAAADEDDGGDFENIGSDVYSQHGDDEEVTESEEDLGDVDDSMLSCKILEFFPQAEKMCYRIKGTTTLDSFQSKSFNVLRRYENFLWLHDRLLENKNLSGVVIPSLPKKVTWVSPEPTQISQTVDYSSVQDAKLLDDFQKRAHQLNRFLKRICRHKLVREDVHVVVFLEYAEDLKPNNKRSWFSNNIWYWDWIGSNRDEKAKAEREWATDYRKKIQSALPLSEAKATASRALASAEVEVMLETRQWDEDPDTDGSRIWRYFSNALIRSQINHHLQAQIEDSMTALLNEVDGTTEATVDALDRSAAVQGQEKESEVVLNRALRSAGPAETRSESTKLKLSKMQHEHEEIVKASEITEDISQSELAMVKLRRVSDFKDLFISLANNEVFQAKVRLESWGEFLAEIQRVQVAPPIEHHNDEDEDEDEDENEDEDEEAYNENDDDSHSE